MFYTTETCIKTSRSCKLLPYNKDFRITEYDSIRKLDLMKLSMLLANKITNFIRNVVTALGAGVAQSV
jgi:hypothetical protein